eukprot:scaffold69980_cov73-Phaeocystis_antarctica.AAC.2
MTRAAAQRHGAMWLPLLSLAPRALVPPHLPTLLPPTPNIHSQHQSRPSRHATFPLPTRPLPHRRSRPMGTPRVPGRLTAVTDKQAVPRQHVYAVCAPSVDPAPSVDLDAVRNAAIGDVDEPTVLQLAAPVVDVESVHRARSGWILGIPRLVARVSHKHRLLVGREYDSVGAAEAVGDDCGCL